MPKVAIGSLKKWLLWKANGCYGNHWWLRYGYNGSHWLLLKVHGCYGSYWLLLKVNGCFGGK
jgi:hypothetical protein